MPKSDRLILIITGMIAAVLSYVYGMYYGDTTAIFINKTFQIGSPSSYLIAIYVIPGLIYSIMYVCISRKVGSGTEHITVTERIFWIIFGLVLTYLQGLLLLIIEIFDIPH